MWHEHASSAAGHHLLQSLATAGDATDAAAGGGAAAGAVPLLQAAPLMLLQAVPLMLLQCGRGTWGEQSRYAGSFSFYAGITRGTVLGKLPSLGGDPCRTLWHVLCLALLSVSTVRCSPTFPNYKTWSCGQIPVYKHLGTFQRSFAVPINDTISFGNNQ